MVRVFRIANLSLIEKWPSTHRECPSTHRRWWKTDNGGRAVRAAEQVGPDHRRVLAPPGGEVIEVATAPPAMQNDAALHRVVVGGWKVSRRQVGSGEPVIPAVAAWCD